MNIQKEIQELLNLQSQIIQKMQDCEGIQCTKMMNAVHIINNTINELGQAEIDKIKLGNLVELLEKEKEKQEEIANFLDKAAKIVKVIIRILSVLSLEVESNYEMKFEAKLGWIPDIPDIRDLTPETESIKFESALKGSIPTKVDLRSFCSPVENQLNLGSCTAQAGVGLLEMFQRKSTGKYTDLSTLFVYKVTRNLLGWTGDTGAYLRTTMKALVAFGAPPQKYWPYDVTKYEVEPSSFVYAMGDDYSATSYIRLDNGYSGIELLNRIKSFLANNYPSMFGFSVYNSYQSSGTFPFPELTDKAVGGHAVIAVGYDDTKQIIHPITKKKTVGAILIKNSWGTSWGENGYGWLPYQYVISGLTADWWTLYNAKYLDTISLSFD